MLGHQTSTSAALILPMRGSRSAVTWRGAASITTSWDSKQVAALWVGLTRGDLGRAGIQATRGGQRLECSAHDSQKV